MKEHGVTSGPWFFSQNNDGSGQKGLLDVVVGSTVFSACITMGPYCIA